MEEKKVSFARHNQFYKKFFIKHRDMLDKFISMNIGTIGSSFQNLRVFYSTYSYYLQSDEDLKQDIIDTSIRFKSNERYKYISNKIKLSGIKSLKAKEFVELNNIYFKLLTESLELFESCCHTLAPGDIMPDIHEVHTEHERNVLFASYDIFYECLFELHSKISSELMEFSIMDYKEMTKMTMAFLYGYSYYIESASRVAIKEMFKELIDEFNNKAFITAYFNLVHGSASKNDYTKLKEYRNNIFEMCTNIFEMINNDLPRKNLFPRKTDKVTVDVTLI